MNKKLTTDALNRPSVQDFQRQDKYPIVVVLDDVRSLANVGSIFRTCDAFNVQEVLLCGITGCPPHRDIQRTALGATESVSWKHEPDVMQGVSRLKDDGYTLIALEQCESSRTPNSVRIEKGERVALVLGNEVNGVAQAVIDHCDLVMEIPQSGTKHSLNVTVAGGVALWELYKQFLNVD